MWKAYKPLWLAVAAVLGVVLLLWLAGAAQAQTVDLRPAAASVLEWLASALAVVLTTLGGFAIRYANARTGLVNSQTERDLQERLDFIIHKSIDFTLVTAQNEVAKRGAGLGAVKVDNYFIKLAADAVMTAAPGIISQFRLSREAVERMVIARVPSIAPVVVAPADGPAIAGGMATPALAKEVARELGRPTSDWREADATTG